jgi:3-dehydroquinate synthase
MSASFEIEIRSSFGAYTVRIGAGLARELVAGSGALLAADAGLLQAFAWLDGPRTIALTAAESAKTLHAAADVVEALRDRGADRGSHLVAVGGGIVQDVATMSASIYMRGIKWTYCPTTLLGMVDSCVGGKSSINVGRYKNIAGNFYPPTQVVIDTDFCRTLPLTQRAAGLCEAVKICFADTGKAFDDYLALAARGDLLAGELLPEVIALSLSTKKRFIEEDEFDNGVRLLLNFGHTFGHALEAAGNFSISHGVAVGLGMLASLAFSQEQTPGVADVPRVRALVAHVRGLLAQVPDVGAHLRAIDCEDALRRFKSDKKHRKDEFAVISYTADGFLQRQFIPASEDSERRIVRAFRAIQQAVA